MRFLLQRLAHDLRAGLAAFRYGTVRAANRALEETERLQARLQMRRLDDRMNEVHREIGERALELHERGEAADGILGDPEIVRSLEQVRTVNLERAKLLTDLDLTGGPE